MFIDIREKSHFHDWNVTRLDARPGKVFLWSLTREGASTRMMLGGVEATVASSSSSSSCVEMGMMPLPSESFS